MAIIDKTEIQQKEIVLSFFYFITRSSVMLFIATYVPMRYALYIAWNMFNIFKFKRKEAGLCYIFSFVINIG